MQTFVTQRNETYAKRMRNVCETYAKRMRNVCETYAKRMRNVCETYAKRMRNVCETYAKRMVMVGLVRVRVSVVVHCVPYQKSGRWTGKKILTLGPKPIYNKTALVNCECTSLQCCHHRRLKLKICRLFHANMSKFDAEIKSYKDGKIIWIYHNHYLPCTYNSKRFYELNLDHWVSASIILMLYINQCI